MSRVPRNPAPDELLLEVDGPDIHPETVDTRAAITLVYSFVKLLDLASTGLGEKVHLRGFKVIDKCFQVVMEATNQQQALTVLRAALDPTPSQLVSEVVTGRLYELQRRFDSARWAFGPATSVKISVGRWVRVLETRDVPLEHRLIVVEDEAMLEPSTAAKLARTTEQAPDSATTLRARLVTISVATSKPRATFRAPSEQHAFPLTMTPEQVVKYARYIGQDVDVEATIRRNTAGKIVGGRVRELFPMDENLSSEAWLEWLTKAGKGWSEVEDHFKELGRNDD